MDFNLILKNLLEKAIHCFNIGDYTGLDELIIKNVQFTAPAYKNNIINEPAVCINDKEELFAYWKRMHGTYPFSITEFEFLEIGKISKFRNTMPDFGYVIDAEIHFNEYGKATKIFNEVSSEILIK